MQFSRWKTLSGFILIMGLLLTSCRGQATPESSPTVQVEVATETSLPAETAYPQPTTITQPTLSGYPGPIETPSTESYLPSAVSTDATNPYPGSGTAIPGGSTPYPGPGSEISPTAHQITPATPTMASQAVLTPSPTPIKGTPLPTPDNHLLATDPDTFHIVSGKVQMVEFFAFWCVHCLMMAPVMNDLEREYSDDVNFVYLDVDDPDTKPFKEDLHFYIPRQGIEPYFVLLDEEGKILNTWMGLQEAEEFQPWIQDAIN